MNKSTKKSKAMQLKKKVKKNVSAKNVRVNNNVKHKTFQESKAVRKGQNAPLYDMGGVPRKNYTSQRGSRPPAGSNVRDIMARNADIYAQSLMDPFEIRGARVPDASPYPSTIGTSIMRYQPAQIQDTGIPSEYIGMAFGLNPGADGFWTSVITAAASNVITWTAAEHPHQVTFASQFAYIRTVSMGVRVLNISKLVERGGALYVAYSCMPPGTTTIDEIKLSDECEVYDSARLEEEGLMAVWIPMTRSVTFKSAAVASPSGQTYVDPAVDYGDLFQDAYIYIWANAEAGSDITMEWEQVHNWESIPHPANQFLFDRKSVVSSEDAIAVARQTHTAPAVSSAARHAGSLSGGLSDIGNKVGKSVLGQIESMAMKGLSMLPGLLFSLFDMQKHTIAISAGLGALSPRYNPVAASATMEEFLEMLDVEIQCRLDPVKNGPPIRLVVNSDGKVQIGRPTTDRVEEKLQAPKEFKEAKSPKPSSLNKADPRGWIRVNK